MCQTIFRAHRTSFPRTLLMHHECYVLTPPPLTTYPPHPLTLLEIWLFLGCSGLAPFSVAFWQPLSGRWFSVRSSSSRWRRRQARGKTWSWLLRFRRIWKRTKLKRPNCQWTSSKPARRNPTSVVHCRRYVLPRLPWLWPMTACGLSVCRCRLPMLCYPLITKQEVFCKKIFPMRLYISKKSLPTAKFD